MSNYSQAIWVGLGRLSTLGISIVSAAILSRYFEKVEYGTYKQILFVYNSLSLIFTAGLPKVFSYFLPQYSREEGKDIVVRITKMLFIAGATFSLFLFLMSDLISSLLQNDNLAIGLKYFSVIPVLLLPTLGVEGIFASYQKTQYIAVYNTITRLLMLALIVFPVILWGGGYLMAIYGWILASVITLLIAFYFKNIPFRGEKQKKSALLTKDILTYSIPIAAASLAGIAIRSADQFFISRYFGTEVFAEYSNGFLQIPLVQMVVGATGLVLMPQFTKTYKQEKDVDSLIALLRRAVTKSAVLIYPIVVFFFFTAKEVVVLLYSSTYENSSIYFQIAIILNLFNIVIFAPLLMAMGESAFYAKIHYYSAVIVWLIAYIVVIFIHSPIAIAVVSVLNSVGLIIVAMRKVVAILDVNMGELIPLRDMTKILLLAILNMSVITFGFSFIPFSESLMMLELGIKAIVFAILILLFSPLVQIDYSWVYLPFKRFVKF